MHILKFLRENNFLMYKDGTWYSIMKKWNKELGHTTYYKDEQLMKLIEN